MVLTAACFLARASGISTGALTSCPAKPPGQSGWASRVNRLTRFHQRRGDLLVRRALILEPTGTGDCSHLDRQYSPPGPITLPETGTFEVGRNPPADILLPMPTVSGRHALLKIGGGQVTITDLGSTNGTYIDGLALDEMTACPLDFGSEVIFGDEFLCRFVLLDDEKLDDAIIDVDPTSS